MTQKAKVLTFLIVVALLLVPATAQAYYYTGYKWASASVYYMMDTNLSSTAKSCIQSMATQWTNAPGNYNLVNAEPNTAYWTKASFRANGWADMPGQTFWVANTTTKILTSVTSYLNTDYAWYNSGYMDLSNHNADYKTIALHEMGHWGRLGHPSQIGQNHPEAAMEPLDRCLPSLATDDKNGIDYIY